MSFTVKCDSCGAEQKFTENDSGEERKILIYGSRDQDVTIRCTNVDCPSWILID